MAERFATATVDHRPTTTAVGQAERRVTAEQRIWQETSQIVNDHMATAKHTLELQHEPIAAERVALLASARQLRELEQADTDEWTTDQLTANRIALVILESPFAAEAQAAQDRSPAKTRREKAQRVGTLVQFNHDFAATLACMPPRMLERFPDALERGMQAFGDRLGLATLDHRSYRRIVNGMTREVAFARALNATMPEGWSMRHATNAEDMVGVDVIVTNPAGEHFNIDLKTHNAFLDSLDKLYEDGRVSRHEYEVAQQVGYLHLTNRVGSGHIRTCLVDADQFGSIESFEYEKPETVLEFVQGYFTEQAQRLRSLGERAINT